MLTQLNHLSRKPDGSNSRYFFKKEAKMLTITLQVHPISTWSEEQHLEKCIGPVREYMIFENEQ